MPLKNLRYVLRFGQHGMVLAGIGFGAHAHSKGAGIDRVHVHLRAGGGKGLVERLKRGL